jgi:hypothetical protein
MFLAEQKVPGQPRSFALLHAQRFDTADCIFRAYGLGCWGRPLSPPPSSKRNGGLHSRFGRPPAALLLPPPPPPPPPPLPPPPLLLLLLAAAGARWNRSFRDSFTISALTSQ